MLKFWPGDFASAADGTTGYVPDATRAALRASARLVRYRLYVTTQHGVRVGSVPFSEGRISWNAEASICRSMACRIPALYAEEIDYAAHRLQPAMQLKMPDGGWCEWPLGLFLPTSPTRTRRSSGERYYSIEAYDQAKALDDDKLTAPLTIEAGVRYLDAAYAQLQAAGILRLVRDDAEQVLAADLQFDIGATRQEVINALLTSVNFRPVWFDEFGSARFTAYAPPYNRRVTHQYTADARSVITPDISGEMDQFEAPNVIVCVCSQAEQALSSVWQNDNAASPLSIARRGRRVVRVVSVTDTADQETLDAYAARLGNQAAAVADSVQFETLNMPAHSAWDILYLDTPEASGKYEEISWGMDLADGGRMQHTARKVVLV